jgi:hypothetical protein
MARSFRAAGFQWATQFAYDPMALAFANTEYQTHYLNLVYTPGKAISFMIAGAAFRETARGAQSGRYPESERFGPFRVSHAEDLSEMVTDTAFFHSNATRTVPPAPAKLRHVAGVGSSPVVSYEGTGAYFLDRLDHGVWFLEVYPDVVWVVDPFTRPSLDREAARVIWRTRPMRLSLPDLGLDFSIRRLNADRSESWAARSGTFDVSPGIFALERMGAPASVAGAAGAFVAPPPSEGSTTVLHVPPAEHPAGQPLGVRVDVVSRDPVDSVALFVRRAGWGRMLRVPMTPVGAFGYRAAAPADVLREGLLEYAVSAYQGGAVRTFPGGAPGDPYRWDFTGRDLWRVPIVAPDAAILLFDARRDLNHVLYPHPWGYVRFRTDVVAGSEPERLALSAVVEDFTPAPDRHFALRTFLADGQRTRLRDATGGVLRVRARATGGRAADRMEVALVERDGTAWGAVIDLTGDWREVVIPVSALRRVPLALLPRPYPLFLPYLLETATNREAPRLTQLDGLQFSVAASLFPAADLGGAHGFEVERVVLDLPR